MPFLKISSIVCEVPEESDKDEIYLMFRDKKIWPQNQKYFKIDVDEILSIDLKISISSPGNLKLELWEYDVTSKNDHLGTFQLDIQSLEAGKFTELLIRDEKGAKRASYYLNWEISD
ncbi:MAG: Ca2+-dependent lipid-binding protein [Cyclobacteriaceae bacterium]|jgi:Ca2+-dependent lipid-binding protein